MSCKIGGGLEEIKSSDHGAYLNCEIFAAGCYC